MKINGEEYSYKVAKSLVVEKASSIKKNKREVFENYIVSRKINGDILKGTRKDIFDIAMSIGIEIPCLKYNEDANEKLRNNSVALLFIFTVMILLVIAIEIIIMV